MEIISGNLKEIGILYLDRSSQRLALNGDEFHCGDSLEIYFHGQWSIISLEYFMEWFAFLDGKRVGEKELLGIQARC